ncbi:hypothetical protein RFI_19993 [Reticulomyxa filosa]|uniref:Uncharacterized protein n=1 Tax=Reticulomyxa filosa TaxID=46433 RepID=X6MV47_RETFI|nr:hypothetical protein RFI_19993 [Reticulomyxa filosa]|eukprot:ETO17332.1 hypothetical protein RFI_19993 [Reticulomyxa filosa]
MYLYIYLYIHILFCFELSLEEEEGGSIFRRLKISSDEKSLKKQVEDLAKDVTSESKNKEETEEKAHEADSAKVKGQAGEGNDSSSKSKTSPTKLSIVQYFGKIFDFYFDALLEKKSVHNFPLIISILNRIEQSRDDTAPFSKNHHYLVFIAIQRLRKKFAVCFFFMTYYYCLLYV